MPAPQRSRQLGPGDKLGPYDLIRQISGGPITELYLARTSGENGEVLVAVKRVVADGPAGVALGSRFIDEARRVAVVRHPNLAQVMGVGRDDGEFFSATEYVHGADLARVIRTANEQGVPISLDAALVAVGSLCGALHVAHEPPHGLVHRALAPSNVLVGYDGTIKLGDFGGAYDVDHGSGDDKVGYMSPEQCKNRPALDRRSDVYALGALLYEMTTGQLPFFGDPRGVRDQIANVDVPPPSKIVHGYPEALETIVLQALARDPAKRYPNTLALHRALEGFAQGISLRMHTSVFARLMSTLFPGRLEEWEHAKSQGAFFVEAHVVQALTERGRIQLASVPVDANTVIDHAALGGEDERTEIVERAVVEVGAKAKGKGVPMTIHVPPSGAMKVPAVGAVSRPTPVPAAKTPVPGSVRTVKIPTTPSPAASAHATTKIEPEPAKPAAPPPAAATPPPDAPPQRATPVPPSRPTPPPRPSTPAPARPTPPPRPSTPAPDAPRAAVKRLPTPAPGAVPIMPAMAGTLVSSSTAAPDVDVDLGGQIEQVDDSVPRASAVHEETMRVRVLPAPRRKKRGALFALFGVLLLGGGAAAVIVIQGGNPAASTASREDSVTPPVPPPSPPPAVAPAPAPAPVASSDGSAAVAAGSGSGSAIGSGSDGAEAAGGSAAGSGSDTAAAAAPAAGSADETKPEPEPEPEPEPVADQPKQATPSHKPHHPAAAIAAKPHLDSRPDTAKPAKPAKPTKEKTWNADSIFLPVKSAKPAPAKPTDSPFLPVKSGSH